MSRRFTYNPTTGCDERHVGKTRELFAQRRFGWADPPPGPSHDDDDDELTRKIAASPAGMASWAGTGPDGETCGRCRLFAPSSPLDGGCKQYVEIRKAQGKGKPKPIPFPANTSACRYFMPR